ncbi:hypothetical protein ATK36_3789 [Amycolatopsis sulphurea]|uniref:Uncharacterized protein n=1 Tax=Amycolatopsis sulphurea TaxID=76022 RepID=A0A2A9FB87_9PSEU|nr:hypothetical protein [Amycolatopsis sulphurea]PFG48687.1 hypothetical protein ATK36_3789 [Amycolatopsis sulphurea]
MDGWSGAGDGAELEYGGYYRQHALWARRTADLQTKMIGLFDKLAEHGEPRPADMRGVAAADDGAGG